MAPNADPRGLPSDQAPSPQEVSNRLDKLEGRLAALRGAFEQYFLGLERHPPIPERDKLRKDIESARFNTGRNTALKFRAASLFNRFLSYEHLWARTLTDIEEGRYHRDLFKARLHRAHRAQGGKTSAPAEDILAFLRRHSIRQEIFAAIFGSEQGKPKGQLLAELCAQAKILPKRVFRLMT